MSIEINAATQRRLQTNQERCAAAYAKLLSPSATGFFDFVILMVCDQEQKEHFMADIERRLAAGS
jgi:hypothetical protein